MVDYLDISIASKQLDASEIIAHLKIFASDLTHWDFRDNESESYTKDIGDPACVINFLKDENPIAKVALAKHSNKKGIYLANIVPKEKPSLTMTEYNEIALQFYDEFRAYVKSSKEDFRLVKCGEDIQLSDIITGSKTRGFFQRFLNGYPTSYHPLDIERLDVFICALSRYKSSINIDLLRRYLLEELNWTERDADWCTKRISTGLAVLRVNRGF